jgi:hypothetical protein
MIKFFDGRIDERHTITTKGTFYKSALQLNADYSADWIFYKDLDNAIYDNAEVIIDVTDEELKTFKKVNNIFAEGQTVIIKSGRKMLNEIKIIKYLKTFIPIKTYGHNDILYLYFTDGTKVAAHHCQVI